MDALALRLAQLDTEAEAAVRVVMFYDTLMRRRVGLPALVRASAAFAECVAGVRLFGTARAIRMSPDGREASDPEPCAPMTAPITLDEEEVGVVWLERPGTPGPFDELLLERLAIAVTAIVEKRDPSHPTMTDPALVELAISSGSDEAARTRALRLMGFCAGLPLHIVAIRSEIPLDQVGRLICPSRPVKAATLAGAGVILATTVDANRFPAGVAAGIGTAHSPDLAWRQALTALRFTGPHEPVVRYADLGALALLTDIPKDAARSNADVAAVARLADNREDLDTLDAYCATGSLRRAAHLLHLHHSSVARRLDHIERTLGIALAEPRGLARARLALAAWRLLDDRAL
ncbi:helix-turn-helix domain-containing protein [Streptosporangium sp. NPDC000396]|uniref:helix-turn-helix domain-containing protein n=1 Tax=Streptosporangium sp. NPDC000396 TaxID=3366185 RepID=UPI0036CE8FF3